MTAALTSASVERILESRVYMGSNPGSTSSWLGDLESRPGVSVPTDGDGMVTLPGGYLEGLDG